MNAESLTNKYSEFNHEIRKIKDGYQIRKKNFILVRYHIYIYIFTLFSHPVNFSQILVLIWWQDPIIKPFNIYPFTKF